MSMWVISSPSPAGGSAVGLGVVAAGAGEVVVLVSAGVAAGPGGEGVAGEVYWETCIVTLAYAIVVRRSQDRDCC